MPLTACPSRTTPENRALSAHIITRTGYVSYKVQTHHSSGELVLEDLSASETACPTPALGKKTSTAASPAQKRDGGCGQIERGNAWDKSLNQLRACFYETRRTTDALLRRLIYGRSTVRIYRLSDNSSPLVVHF